MKDFPDLALGLQLEQTWTCFENPVTGREVQRADCVAIVLGLLLGHPKEDLIPVVRRHSWRICTSTIWEQFWSMEKRRTSRAWFVKSND